MKIVEFRPATYLEKMIDVIYPDTGVLIKKAKNDREAKMAAKRAGATHIFDTIHGVWWGPAYPHGRSGIWIWQPLAGDPRISAPEEKEKPVDVHQLTAARQLVDVLRTALELAEHQLAALEGR